MLATELSVPLIVIEFPFGAAEVISGKFCRLLSPVSTSFGSFEVTPLAPRSMPKLLSKIELPRMAFLLATVNEWVQTAF